MIKYFLNTYEIRRDGQWENKGAYVLYLEFITDCFKLIVYMMFFGTILVYYGIPLHIIRQLYLTFASFRKRIAEVIRYRRATANMDQRYSTLTHQNYWAVVLIYGIGSPTPRLRSCHKLRLVLCAENHCFRYLVTII
jgi:hypothetical protein